MDYCIAVDAMGGDHGPSVVVPACINVLQEYSNINFILVGKQQLITEELAHLNISATEQKRLLINNATQIVGMDELPSSALRNKKDSSMRLALNLVQQGKAQACVSAGNTGALMAMARFVLKMLPGIDRPAILFALPSIKNKPVYMLDLGANVDCQAEHLFQFAVMGSVLISAIKEKIEPSVGLLNIGTEAIKGTEQVKKAAELLTATPAINYIGYIEADDIFKGVVDLIVCDGFVGNVALKSSEGLAQIMLHMAKKIFNKTWYTKLIALLAKSIFKELFEFFDTNKYNGGSLLGLRGVVIKSHGSANKKAFATALRTAIDEIQNEVPQKIKQKVSKQLECLEL